MRITTPVLTGAVLAAALTLTACGGDDTTAARNTTSPTTSAAPSPTGTPAAGRHNDADVMFAAGMIPHHAQAIEMSDIVLAKDGVDPAVRDLAEQIKAAQGPEIEQMRGWLAGWGQPVPPADTTAMGSMGGMDHSGMGSTMMSEEDMTALEAADGKEASRLFLEQMIVHHQGAIAMARQQLAMGVNPDATKLAKAIVSAQEKEIATMTELLGG